MTPNIYASIIIATALSTTILGKESTNEKEIRNSVEMNHPIKVRYTNYRGETDNRTIVPQKIYWGKTDYHPQEQWLLEVWDVEKNATRIYALHDIQEWFIK